ncbi:MAG: DegT/DnrJ/EryC1/StrS family aminotransferase [Lentisphaerae bacterium]|jgi:dTDP-4-amino-4,6-dideoxygalactose transaminase|nr:DegT/DnrJ/EryC1/StrS family aminotransferase [Lentisphaerota bacterium]MBT5609881.1 DegT/DnrJ/EryC1/StrS family aminotransferase [Lentisphaerota bacterium]MBT7056927.1 DegT/DnrJ/EryC1/StrS family aminotransferase [Lentisphaerota bacterium]MBT7847077.1 DegT/DnrJ/EryC1/StrS family aminotransferase [Lentisphaerota bacterium]
MSVLAINGGQPVRTAPVGVAWPVFDQREIGSLSEVVRSRKWGSTTGTHVREFEKTFAAFCGAKHAICLTTGSAALEVALRAAGVEAGDEVIVPPYTFIATASSVCMIGGVPVFVDIEPGTMNMDPARIESAITPRTKAIVPVHIGGRPADMDGVMSVAEKHGLAVVEDSCQAHGASWRGRKVATLGTGGAFSFQASKNINAGEGGAIVTNDDEFYLRCYSIVNVGRIPQGDWYQHEFLGSNYRMTEFQGAILLAQIARWEEQAATRDANAAQLDRLLADVDGIATLDDDPRITRNAWHLYVFRYLGSNRGVSKETFVKAVSAEGVHVSTGYTPLHTTGLFQQFSKQLEAVGFYGGRRIDYSELDLPATQNACENEACWFPQTVLLAPASDVADVAAAVRKVCENLDELV